MIRTVLPTDLVALVSFESKAFPNEAKTRDRLGKEGDRPMTMGAILEHWLSFEGNRRTWLAAHGLSIQGLVSARRRFGRTVWEVDWLVLAADEEPTQTTLHLLDRLCEDGSRWGIEKVFLRLACNSSLVDAARRSGFWPYLTESLYRQEVPHIPKSGAFAALVGLRPMVKADEQSVFRLYHEAVPDQVRRAKGMTFREWCEGQETSLAKRRDFVFEEEGNIRAWVRVARGEVCHQIEFMFHPSCEEMMEPLVAFALTHVDMKAHVLCLVPQYQVRLARALEDGFSFQPVREYCALVKQLAVRVKDAALVPARM